MQRRYKIINAGYTETNLMQKLSLKRKHYLYSFYRQEWKRPLINHFNFSAFKSHRMIKTHTV